MTNDSGAWHAKLQREEEAIRRKRAERATRTRTGATTAAASR